MRNLLSFSSGIQKTIFWDLTHNTEDRYDMMTLMFGKNKLFEFKDGKVIKEYPEVGVFTRMMKHLAGMKSIQKSQFFGKPFALLFEIVRSDKSVLFIAWQRLDAFTGENQGAVPYSPPLTLKSFSVTDIFGKYLSAYIVNANIEIEISATPVYIESKEWK